MTEQLLKTICTKTTMTNKLTIKQIAQAIKGDIIRDSSQVALDFSTDTRSIKSGAVFFPLKGENFDGHNFIDKAIANGASIIVTEQTFTPPSDADIGIIKVTNTLKALQQLASFKRSNLKAKFVAVTGSNGKTTTRQMLTHMLSHSALCSSTHKNYNNHIGLPLSLLAIPEDAQYSILEMGMNHTGEIRELCSIANPNFAMISSIGTAHIGLLGSIENIAKAKSEILESLTEKAFAIVPGDNASYLSIFKKATKARLVTFGLKSTNDYSVKILNIQPHKLHFEVKHQTKAYEATLNISAEHNILNATAALAAYHQLGLDLEQGIKLLESFKTASGRMQTQTIDGVNLIVDCYNANSDSMIAAIRHLYICPPPRIAVLGDMGELGEHSIELHEKVGASLALMQPELTICIGKLSANIIKKAESLGVPKESLIQLSSNAQAAELLRKRLQKGSTVLFKASRSMKLETILHEMWPELESNI